MVLDQCSFRRHCYARLDRPPVRKQSYRRLLFSAADTSLLWSQKLRIRVCEAGDGRTVGCRFLRRFWHSFWGLATTNPYHAGFQTGSGGLKLSETFALGRGTG